MVKIFTDFINENEEERQKEILQQLIEVVPVFEIGRVLEKLMKVTDQNFIQEKTIAILRNL